MPRIPGLRSPHARVGRIVVFGRMLDKIRLEARGALPGAYRDNLGDSAPAQFDARCCRFLGVGYGDIRKRTLEGGCDEEILAWAASRGAPRTDEECEIWNRFITKLGWRDDRSARLADLTDRYGIAGPRPETLCELFDADEGRPLGGTRSWEAKPLAALVVMGVSGCGKSTIASALARDIGWEYMDADSMHPAANIAKMAAGIPLDDADRAPWLAAVRVSIEACIARGGRAVAACSALKRAYREVLAPDPAAIRFIYLRGDYELFHARLHNRTGHFMKEGMLRSQFEDLEEPRDALTLDASLEAPLLVARTREVLGLP